MRTDLIVTWPKSRPLSSYLGELRKAERNGLVINYRVRSEPNLSGEKPARCYMVHDGEVRGYGLIVDVAHRREGEVLDVGGGFWPAGWYIVRDPKWYPLAKPVPRVGFRGYRYVDPRDAVYAEDA